jgi:hypothetical protein
MAEWQRDNPWRQGSILKSESVKSLGLVHPKSPDDTVVIIISHDCDLAQTIETEPFCEAIPGCPVDGVVSGDLTNAKNIRRLHLTFNGGTIKLAAEFIITDKQKIDKSALVDHQPAANVRLAPAELNILQTWLAVRYRRSSFPDEFDRRIKDKEAKFYDKFVKAVKGSADHLLTILFDVDGGTEVDRKGPDDTYTLSIYLVHNVTIDPGKAKEAVDALAEKITNLFKSCYFKDGKWLNIELRTCETMSEAAVTIHQYRLLKPLTFEYLSLREEAQGPIAP